MSPIEQHRISVDHITDLASVTVHTEADEASRVRAVVQAFQSESQGSKRNSINHEWDIEETFRFVPTDTLQTLGAILTKESIDKVYLDHTPVKDFSVYLASIISDILENDRN